MIHLSAFPPASKNKRIISNGACKSLAELTIKKQHLHLMTVYGFECTNTNLDDKKHRSRALTAPLPTPL